MLLVERCGMMRRITAIVCTYAKDNADDLFASLQSLTKQTRLPDEILIVEDGSLTTELETVLAKFEVSSEVPVRRVAHKENQGHGAARQTGIVEARHELVAIQDADDIALPQRLKLSVEKLTASDADLVGGYIEEFQSESNNPHAVRKVPCEPSKIRRMAKFRSPVNHTTVLARRKAILDAGNYRKVGQMEDYELWARMLINDNRLVNIPRVLAKVRAGEDMYQRRGGITHIIEEIRLQRHFVEIGFVSRPRAIANIILRALPKVVPNRVRGWIYTWLFRDTSELAENRG